MRQAAAFLSCWRLPMSGSADCGNPWRKQRTGISGLTLRAFLCCYVSSIRSFMFLRKREGRKGKKMTEAAEKFIPIFVGLLLILRGLFWIVDGKKLFLWHSGHYGRNHYVHNRVFSGFVKRGIDSESLDFCNTNTERVH